MKRPHFPLNNKIRSLNLYTSNVNEKKLNQFLSLFEKDLQLLLDKNRKRIVDK